MQVQGAYHPILLPLLQQTESPGAQSHEYLGTRPKASTDATTTPMGWNQMRLWGECQLTWKVLKAASKNRLFLGRNSMTIVASMGIFPPTPNPSMQ